MPPDSRDEELLDQLLVDWEERWEQGEDVPPEILCPDRPDLWPGLRRRIEALKQFDDKPQAVVPTSSLPGPASGSEPEDPSIIGRYEVRGRLGKGGFGTVYLGWHGDLRCLVAIKVPNPERVDSSNDFEAYLKEARILAQLRHPNIVRVLDAGQTNDGRLCYLISEYIEGSNLAEWTQRKRPLFRESAELVATIAEALHYAHTAPRNLVHRDIKPANILLDAANKPYVADFGLALREEDYGKGPGFAGTPSYMSPEQARGEGHRVDGRSDVFSLGVVFYELLTGRRPFRGALHAEVLEHVVIAEPRPPRQIDDTIPKELERIILKALSKRATDRYTTARDMADDLRHFLQTGVASGSPTTGSGLDSPSPGSTQTATPIAGRLDSYGPVVKVVPKGLRSFEQHDADFFLELLPGPRDRDGLPESIRFWKTRIESTDSDAAFKVGLIYGPSGCGKSSLIKAGLLPRLGKHVLVVYVEATPDETETRLLKAVRKACPGLSAELSLVESLAALRRRPVLRPGEKVLLVLDQFEQWLFARRGEETTELIAALRQCDGEHVQVVVMVRDDFWLAASRFMRDLETRLVEGENSSLVDLFDPLHARKVLAAFGRAYGVLPERPADLTPEQQSFLDQAVAGLTQDGKVISVRLALFAEMVKGKPWKSATLRQVGGTAGVGVTFLEETFSASTAPPEHRLHQKGAQCVLKALLPQIGNDIKGQMRSESELREASGYTNRPRDFDNLLRILDSKLRLITPTDPEGASYEVHTPPSAIHRYYQLTHDYLVHSLREWVTRKQRETRRGQAELRLADRAALWNAKPENRHLPLILEWVTIRLLTKNREWTESQRQMMKRASRVHGRRGLGLAILIALATWGAVEVYGNLQASSLVESLKRAGTAEVLPIVKDLSAYRSWAIPRLRRMLEDPDDRSRNHLHASLVLLEIDPSQVDYLAMRLLNAGPTEVPVLRKALESHQARLTPILWAELENARLGDASLLASAGALALFDPESPRWVDLGGKVAQALVTVNSIVLGTWLDSLRPIRGRLTAPLVAISRDKTRPEDEHTQATDILVDYARDEPGRLAEVLMAADSKAFRKLFPVAERQAAMVVPLFQAAIAPTSPAGKYEAASEQQARAAIALIRLGHAEEVWPLLRHSSDPRLRSFLVNWLLPLGVDPRSIAAELFRRNHATSLQPVLTTSNMDTILFHPETSIRRALILGLGEIIAGQELSSELTSPERDRIVKSLLASYRNDVDAGVHSAAEWTLRRWQLGDELEKIDLAAMSSSLSEGSRWFGSSSGHVMSIIRGPVEFWMGSPLEESERDNDEFPHHEKLRHSFAIAIKEITVKQFGKFLQKNPRIAGEEASGLSSHKTLSVDPNTARNAVTWYEAAAYCNWLSKEEGFQESQLCYLPNKDGQYAEGMRIVPDLLMRTGYRLPTEAEWEYVCRSGSDTSRPYGTTEELLDNYAWYLKNDEGYRPGGEKKPNDLGLFDTLGNVWEWCHDEYNHYSLHISKKTFSELDLIVIDKKLRVLRGAAIDDDAKNVRSANRGWNGPSFRYGDYGFRIARTLP